jgi:hypothetical protein
MNIRMANAPELLSPTGWFDATITQIGSKTVVVKPDGRVVSVQPTGEIRDRDPGTNGPWEECSVDPGLNVLHYTGTGIPYVVAYHGR